MVSWLTCLINSLEVPPTLHAMSKTHDYGLVDVNDTFAVCGEAHSAGYSNEDEKNKTFIGMFRCLNYAQSSLSISSLGNGVTTIYYAHLNPHMDPDGTDVQPNAIVVEGMAEGDPNGSRPSLLSALHTQYH